MEYSSRKGIRIFLAALLSVSLLGTSGMQMLSEAFASEGDDAVEPTEQQMASSADNADENEPTSTFTVDEESEASPSDEADSLDSQQPDNASWRLVEPSEDLETTEESADLVEAQSISVPETRYVYEYVYGIINDGYTIGFNDRSEYEGALISAEEGTLTPEGMAISSSSAEAFLNNELTVIPFRENGKYGLWDAPSKNIIQEPVYDKASGRPSCADGQKWGFISYGEPSGTGTYPDAAAIIWSEGKEVFRLPLKDCAGEAYISYGGVFDPSSNNRILGWSIDWKTSTDSFSQSISIIETVDGFKTTSNYIGFDSHTPDGRMVQFISNDDSLGFIISDPATGTSKSFSLNTDQTSTYSCRLVSNLIEVSGSNGFDRQYFTLDGSLLQNLNGISFTGLGNYVSYERNAFDGSGREQVFLDTSDECKEAVSIPILKGSFGNAYRNAQFFECITPDNKIQHYNEKLELVKEFDAVLDMAKHKSEGRYLSWDLIECSNGNWIVQEQAGGKQEPSAGCSLRVVGGKKALESYAAIGLASPYTKGMGCFGDNIYFMDDSGSDTLRIFDENLSFVKAIDLKPFIPSDAELISMSANASYDVLLKNNSIAEIQIAVKGESSVRSKDLYLNASLDAFDYLTVRTLSDSVFCAKKNDGKCGFVDSTLNPRSDFVYDSIFTAGWWDYQSIETLFEARIGDKIRIFDENLNDVFGYDLDSFQVIDTNVYLVEHGGSSHVYQRLSDGSFKEISLYGYRLAKTQATGCRSYNVRTLPNGTLMLYVQDSQGKVGAIDSAGNIIIPLEYDAYAEDAGVVPHDSEYIMLKDADGWFFVSVADLQSQGPNDECDAQGHAFTENVYPPTCTADGYTQKVCKRCGWGYKDESTIVPKLGHDYQQISVDKEPTCTEDGSYAYSVCSRCGDEIGNGHYERPALGHDWDYNNRQIITYPTCTEDGLARYTCKRCGLEEDQPLPAYGHDWSYEPEWTWSSDFQSVTARTHCMNGCGEYLPLEVKLTHENAEGGMRHSAVVNINGRDVKDGRLTLGWTDANGVTRSLLVKGAPVADGFTAWPQGLVLPSDAGKQVEIDVVPVSSGGVFDALVSKIGDGWPAGTFDVRLNVDGEETHEGFGSLTFAFPGGPASPGKKAVIHHCHKDDRTNITSHESFVTADGKIILGNIVDLSTFALEVLDDDAFVAGSGGEQPTKNQGYVGGLAQTGDETMVSVLIGFLLIYLALFSGIAAFMILKRRKSDARR